MLYVIKWPSSSVSPLWYESLLVELSGPGDVDCPDEVTFSNVYGRVCVHPNIKITMYMQTYSKYGFFNFFLLQWYGYDRFDILLEQLFLSIKVGLSGIFNFSGNEYHSMASPSCGQRRFAPGWKLDKVSAQIEQVRATFKAERSYVDKICLVR